MDREAWHAEVYSQVFQTLNALTYSEGGGLGGGDLATRMLTRAAAPLWLM